MNEIRMLFVVVICSVLIFLFISLVLGSEENADFLVDKVRTSKSCEPGYVYSDYVRKCKPLVQSNKRFAEAIQLLLPYYDAYNPRMIPERN